MRLTLVLVLTLSLLSVACGDDGGNASSTPDNTPDTAAAIIPFAYDGGTLQVEVAQTPEQRERGLGYRDALAQDSGMLFDLGETRLPGFWMKGMRFPLDMVWIDEHKQITGVTAHVQPQPGVADTALRRYSPEAPVRYVLELNAGAAARLGLDAGGRVDFELP
jgi:uncharacterized membrane protein (UPF0127 family)